MKRTAHLAMILATLALVACGGGKKKGSICVSGQDCPAGQGCYLEACVALCATSCDTSQTCVVIDGNAVCVESQLVSKQGTETQDMTPDNGAEDTGDDSKLGTEDQSADKISGSEDQSTLDNGTPDSGTPDSGTPDSSNPDLGTPDVIVSDTTPPPLSLGCGNVEGSVWVEQAPAPGACRDLQITGGIASYSSKVLTSSNFLPTPPNLTTAFPNVTINSPCNEGGKSASVEVEVTDGNSIKAMKTCTLNCVKPLALSCASYLNVTAGKTENDNPIEWTVGVTDKQISLTASGGWLGGTAVNKYNTLGLEVKDGNGTVVPYADVFDKPLLTDLTSGVITFGGACKKAGTYSVTVTVQDQPGTCYANTPLSTLCNVVCKTAPPQDKLTIPADPGGGMVTFGNWMLVMDDGGVDEEVMISYKDLTPLPTLPGIIAAIELTTDKPDVFCKWLKVKYDTTSLPGGKTYALLVSYDGGASWYDMLGWLEGNLLWGQIFQQSASMLVALVEIATPILFTSDAFGPEAPRLTNESLTQIDAKVISAQVTGTFTALRQISIGDPQVPTLEFSFRNAQFQTKKLQYKVGCQQGRVNQELLLSDASDAHDLVLTSNGSDNTKMSQDSIAAHDLVALVYDGADKVLDAATRLYHVATQTARELQMLTVLNIGGVTQLLKVVVASQASGQNLFSADVWSRIFAKRLLITRVRYQYFFGVPEAALLIRSLWDQGSATWRRLELPCNKLLDGLNRTYLLLEARVTAKHLFVLAIKRQLPSVSCSNPGALLQHLTLFVFDTNLRLVKSIELPNLTMDFALYKGLLRPVGFFAVQSTTGGYEVMIGANDSKEVNDETDTCPTIPTKKLTTSLRMAFISIVDSSGTLTETVTVSDPVAEAQKYRTYNANHETNCRDNINGPKDGLTRYIWNVDYFAIAVDRCGRSSGPLSIERGGIMVFSADGQKLVANIATPYIPELMEGTNGMFLAQNAQRAPSSANDPKEVHVFKVSRDQQNALQVELRSVYPRRGVVFSDQTEHCHYVFSVCGDKLLCARIDKDTQDKVYLQLLAQTGTLPAVTGTTSSLGSNAAGLGFWMIGLCTSDDNFRWTSYRYTDTEAIVPPTSAPVTQQCL